MHAFTSVESLRLSKRGTVSAKQLAKHQLRQGQVQHLSISTDRGVVVGPEGVAKKLGGVPLFKIY